MKTANTIQDTAATLRTTLRERRNNMDHANRSRGGLLLRGRLFTWLALRRETAEKAGHASPARIAAFHALDGEPDLLPLLAKWVEEDGLEVLLPAVISADQPLVFRAWHPDSPMKTGAYGVQEVDGPDLAAADARLDVVLVPTLGWTAKGDRLGYGGGYYDRTLAQLRPANPALIALGISWEEGRLPVDYQPAGHDAKLDAVLTPGGWYPRMPA
ncbi:5-formyltetrahydrofolate cyclo-ligase [Kerstersia gyiorum]|jgi:5-formyltetrahydrofolate cyclo-ligase|uniref:5-formyltetrahydrofolate cyclo-ligase n=1 Tax=Kerstersia gyiorum TaxID=206506 RepID=UPI00242D7EF4|nr:5-formyltetrahydrofolate cyclo-ligase [Kerstersia gyiorum]MCH4270564.1 5-formyltetrahydrofolate cyclo-ligase [Kerstersia gyiorum]MCI1228167.1 5-formyltetrahydrofolate cyclo-ligase [Kerstersia gyiorum]